MYNIYDVATTGIRHMDINTPEDGLSEHMDNLSLQQQFQSIDMESEYRFFGKSSSPIFVQAALEIRNAYGRPGWNVDHFLASRRGEFWSVPPASTADNTVTFLRADPT